MKMPELCHAGMDGRYSDSQDASGDIRIGLDSSTPCWNDAKGILIELTKTHPTSSFSKESMKFFISKNIQTLRPLRAKFGSPTSFLPRAARGRMKEGELRTRKRIVVRKYLPDAERSSENLRKQRKLLT
jgi:hypothetical protein